jgi:hypothetical protein
MTALRRDGSPRRRRRCDDEKTAAILANYF